MEIITLREDYIKLGQALKAAALVEDGVEAKLVIKDGCVTVRHRDSMEQVRIKIDELDAYFADKFTF